MALAGRTAYGLRKFPALRPGGAVAVVAPSSPFTREAFDAGCRELERLGLHPVFDDSVFEAGPIVAGSARSRADALARAWQRDDVSAVMAVRGGYGSLELLPLVDPAVFRRRPLPFIGYSDTTSLHVWLNGYLGFTSIHGPMLQGRLELGESAYDPVSFLGSLGETALGELSPDGLEIVSGGEARGVLVGGTLTSLCTSLGTPFEFQPPDGAVIFIDEVGERPYRVRRMLEHLRQSGKLARAVAFVFGQLPRCDEPDGRVTARQIVGEFAREQAVPTVMGFPSGHTTTPLVTLPFGVEARVVASGHPRLVIEEPAAC